MRRRIDGIAERFMADNYTQYGEKFKELAQEFVNDPLCTSHYEYDIQWSLLHFLLEVSKNPVAALSEDKNCIRIDDSGHGDDIRPDRRKSAMNELVNSLLKHNIPTTKGKPKGTNDESDLSVSKINYFYCEHSMIPLNFLLRHHRIGPTMKRMRVPLVMQVPAQIRVMIRCGPMCNHYV